MISVFFVPGMFGSSIEYMLRQFSDNFSFTVAPNNNGVEGNSGLHSDGSMHSFRKEWHAKKLTDYGQDIDVEIATPVYPTKAGKLLKILEVYPHKSNAKNVLIYADSLRSAELNMLFQYHKIADGAAIQHGLQFFCDGNEHNIVNWNTEYTHWSQMQQWELREWMSMFYVTWTQEWINSQHEVPESFLKISNTDMLFHPKDTIKRIFNFCNVTMLDEIDSFVDEWTEKQQYVINEFNLLDEIVFNTIRYNNSFSWEPLHIVAAAIVQQRLRTFGYEIACRDLNRFPTDVATLRKYIINGPK